MITDAEHVFQIPVSHLYNFFWCVYSGLLSIFKQIICLPIVELFLCLFYFEIVFSYQMCGL